MIGGSNPIKNDSGNPHVRTEACEAVNRSSHRIGSGSCIDKQNDLHTEFSGYIRRTAFHAVKSVEHAHCSLDYAHLRK